MEEATLQTTDGHWNGQPIPLKQPMKVSFSIFQILLCEITSFSDGCWNLVGPMSFCFFKCSTCKALQPGGRSLGLESGQVGLGPRIPSPTLWIPIAIWNYLGCLGWTHTHTWLAWQETPSPRDRARFFSIIPGFSWPGIFNLEDVGNFWMYDIWAFIPHII